MNSVLPIDWEGIRANHYIIRFSDIPLSQADAADKIIEHHAQHRRRKGWTTFNRARMIANEVVGNKEQEFAIIYRINNNGRSYWLYDTRWR